MRSLLFTIASLIAAGSASASSIEVVTSGDIDNSSIKRLSCGHCPPLIVKKRITYVVPEIEPGTERVEIKDVDGQTTMYRTEAWLGGSPIIFVNKLSKEALQAATTKPSDAETASSDNQAPKLSVANDPVIIDGTAKTGALEASVTAPPVTVEDNRSQEVDLGNAQLRLD